MTEFKSVYLGEFDFAGFISSTYCYRFCSGLEGVKTGIFLRGEATALPILGLNASGQARRSLWEGPALSLDIIGNKK